MGVYINRGGPYISERRISAGSVNSGALSNSLRREQPKIEEERDDFQARISFGSSESR
jgi:hypothetical protein